MTTTHYHYVGVTPQGQYALADGESWLSGWTYRQKYNITGAAGAGTDYQVFLNITYNSRMQTDFDDLRATDNDGITLLDAWLEDKTDSSFAAVWVEVADSLSTDSAIYVYCGNSTVSDYWDGPATFLLFDDFEDNSVNYTLWNSLEATPPTESGGELALLGASIVVESDDTFSYGSAIGFRCVFWEVRAMGFGDHTPFDKEAYIDTFSGGRLYCRTGTDTATDSFSETQSVWQNLEVFWYNGSYASITENDIQVAEVSNAYVPDADMYAYFRVYDPDNEYLSLEWVYVRILADSTEPYPYLVGEWNTYGEATLLIDVNDPVLNWGFDVGIIILGLVLIPVSGLYLVRGGRKDANMTKVYYALLMFFIGWALFIGGIMP